VGFLIRAQEDYGGVLSDIKSRYNAVDFGYAAGAGYQRKSGVGAGFRYNGGFRNALKEGPTRQVLARNSALQLYLTYSFNGR
jgi:hypothetical protein